MAASYEHLSLDERTSQLQKENGRLKCLAVSLTCAVFALIISLVLQSSTGSSSDSNSSHSFSNTSSCPLDNSTANITSNYFWGVTYVTSNTKSTVSPQSVDILQAYNNYGYSNYEYNQTMIENVRFKIGSNTKLFVAVAIYQLQEKGLLNVTDPINLYLNQTDFIKFGFSNITHWCPIVYNASDYQCENVTFEQLLSMSSGIVEALNCEYGKNSIFQKYCFDTCSEYAYYQGSIAYYIGKFIHSPLMYKPGTQYTYSNANFMLAGYLIEKLSNLKFEQYLSKYITSVMGLSNTYYDPWSNNFNIKQWQTNEYLLYYNGSQVSTSEYDYGSTIGLGSCMPELNNGYTNTAGGMQSTIEDMHQWYHKLFNTYDQMPKVFNNPKSQKEILRGRIQVSESLDNLYFAQGVVVAYRTDESGKKKLNTTNLPEYPRVVYYEGGTLCSHTSMAMYRNFTGNDTSVTAGQDIVVTGYSNAPHAYLIGNHNVKSLDDLMYGKNVSESWCEIVTSGIFEIDDGNAQNMCFKLFEDQTGTSPVYP